MSHPTDRDHVTLFRGAADNSYFELYFNALPSPGAENVQFETHEVDLKPDREVVLAALMNFWTALEHADGLLKADRGVVLAAVKQDGAALKYADDTPKADRELVLAAVKQKGNAVQYADDTLKADRAVMLKAIDGVKGAACINYTSLRGTRQNDRG